MSASKATARFSGRAFLAVMVGFFGVVIAVNITMARLASSTFGGTVVDNSYVASQAFNGWLAQARAQDRLGWATPVALDAARHVVIIVPGVSFVAQGTAHHPLGRAPDVPLAFAADGAGKLVSTTPLPAGRWQVRLQIRSGHNIKNVLDVLA
ncbi:FixH family protein [Sandarakinorhabdus oryzae]|uniref:FixH family protein n=1 Tax=Sandarakinorhabdus oryzae TaxID=2675220 RepID=UPI0012E11092|nr:FixH family protein [Sandarakinorhabdus oryzae]